MVSLRTPEPEWRGDVTLGDETYAESPSASRSYDPREVDPVVRASFATARVGARARTRPATAFAPRSPILLLFLASAICRQPENCRVTSIRSRAPLTLQNPQVVEDILNHSEEIAVAEDGRGGEVTLLRLLKVRPHRETTRDTLNRILIRALERGRMRFARKVPVRRRRPRIRRFFFLFSFFLPRLSVSTRAVKLTFLLPRSRAFRFH